MLNKLMKFVAGTNALGNTVVFGVSLIVPGHWGFVAISFLAMCLSYHLVLLYEGKIKSS